jgi:GNAT superfamily N-acetyltransferase
MIGRLIETGKLRNKKMGSPIEVCYDMKFLDSSHLEEVKELQEIISQSLPDKEIFRLTTVQEFKEHLGQERSVIGVLAEDDLIAYDIISFPGEGAENFGSDIDIFPEELKKVAHLKAVVVHPDFRGNGLQRSLSRVHLEVIRDAGYEHVCSTVSPKNWISVENYFANGFVIKGLKIKYGGLLRYIMYKNIYKPFNPRPKAIFVESRDIKCQKDLLNRGFAGYKLHRRSNGQETTYSINFS